MKSTTITLFIFLTATSHFCIANSLKSKRAVSIKQQVDFAEEVLRTHSAPCKYETKQMERIRHSFRTLLDLDSFQVLNDGDLKPDDRKKLVESLKLFDSHKCI